MVDRVAEVIDPDDGFGCVRFGAGRRHRWPVIQGLMRPFGVVVTEADQDGVAKGVLAKAEHLAKDEILEDLDESKR